MVEVGLGTEATAAGIEKTSTYDREEEGERRWQVGRERGAGEIR
jgi:hypothetical protein